MTKINSLRIYGKRWFQKTYGNTYHAVRIIVNGEEMTSNITYGYGNQYIQTALDMLVKAGYNVPNEYGNFLKFLYENKFKDSVIDVKRKKDLLTY